MSFNSSIIRLENYNHIIIYLATDWLRTRLIIEQPFLISFQPQSKQIIKYIQSSANKHKPLHSNLNKKITPSKNPYPSTFINFTWSISHPQYTLQKKTHSNQRIITTIPEYPVQREHAQTIRKANFVDYCTYKNSWQEHLIFSGGVKKIPWRFL